MKSSWTFDWGESHSMLSAECWLASHLYDRDVMGCFAKEALQTVENRHVGFYFRESEIEDLAEYGRMYLEGDFASRFFEQSAAARTQYRDFYARYRAVDLPKRSTASLGAIFKEYLYVYRRISAFFNASIGFYLEAVEKELRSILLTELDQELLAQEAFSILTLPTEPDIIKLEALDLALLGEEDISSDKLLAHAEAHPWYFFNTYEEQDAIDFLRLQIAEREANHAELAASFAAEQDQTLRRQEEVLSQLEDASHAGYLASLLRKFGHDRLELKAVWSGSEFLFRQLFQEISARLQFPLEDLMWACRGQEIAQALDLGSPLPRDEIESRKEFYLFELSGGRLRFFHGAEAKALAREAGVYGVEQAETEVRGVVAHPGSAQGAARLVFLRDLKQLMVDLDTFQAGEIMVTQMTQPTMVSMAKKAAAIVTDEGGITSHAAIIARELDIPCLVGCKFATKIFKTGERIAVDTDTGRCHLVKN